MDRGDGRRGTWDRTSPACHCCLTWLLPAPTCLSCRLPSPSYTCLLRPSSTIPIFTTFIYLLAARLLWPRDKQFGRTAGGAANSRRTRNAARLCAHRTFYLKYVQHVAPAAPVLEERGRRGALFTGLRSRHLYSTRQEERLTRTCCQLPLLPLLLYTALSAKRVTRSVISRRTPQARSARNRPWARLHFPPAHRRRHTTTHITPI